MKGSSKVCSVLSDSKGVAILAFSLDVKDLFFSLPQNCLLDVVRECIDMFGEVSLQNKVGYSLGGFLASGLLAVPHRRVSRKNICSK